MIIDSSTLILLAKTMLLDRVLKRAKSIMIITSKVEQECTKEKNSFDAALIKKRIDEGKIIVKKIKNLHFYRQLIEDFNLGEGEAEAIALNSEEDDILLTDDRKAINVCRLFNMEFATALNILAELRRQKELNREESSIILRDLAKYGRYSNDLIKI